MNKFYKYQIPEKPFHISVGAVLMDDMDESRHLMRETLEGNEPLQDAVLRGIKEEFGATGTVEKYLGPKIDLIIHPDRTSFEKLTIYHSVRLDKLGERTDTGPEGTTHLEWVPPQKALELYRDQISHTDRPELDERVIIERFIKAYDL